MAMMLVVLAAAGTLPADAQDTFRETGPILLELPVSTRGLALGGGFHPGSRDSDAVFAQPGLLNNPLGMTTALQFWGRGGSLAQISAGTDWWSGGVAVGVRALQHGVTTDVFAALPVDEGDLRSRGDATGAAELQFTAGYGRTVKGVRVGFTGSVIQLQAGGQRDITGALGLGAARAVGPIVLSLAGMNLGPGLEAAGSQLDLPRRVTLAAAPTSNRPVGPFDINGTAYVSFLEDNTITGGGGVELAWWPVQGRTFILRAGARDIPDGSSVAAFTLGGGFQGDRLGLDYAVVPFEDGDAAHRIGLHFR